MAGATPLILTLTLSLAVACCAAARAADVASYPLPPIYEASRAYSLKVDGKPIPVVGYVGEYDYAHFSMSDGPVTVEVTAHGRRDIQSYHISPRKLNIRAQPRGNTLTFQLHRNEYLIVKVSGLKELVIAADPAQTDRPPSSGPGVFNVHYRKYNADPEARRMSTSGIQRAIDDASAYGTANGTQGIVYVPAGVYLVGNLVLKSDAAVYLEGGAVLRCTANRDDYEGHWFKNSMGADVTWFIYTDDHTQNIKLYGRGTIDGNGWNLWENSKKTKRMANNLLVPKHVSGFTCDGLIIRDPSAWSTIPVRSDNVVFRNMKFFCRLNMGENDGIDVVECQDVLVQNAIGIALDDPFSTKSWSATTDIALNWSGEPEPLRNVLIEDTISWTHCYGYKVGQGVMQDQDGVTFRNGVVYDAAVGLGVHHKYGKAEARNITFENIEIERQHGHNDGKAAWLVLHVQENGAGVGPIKGVHLKDILVHDAGSGPAMIKGHGREGWISDVRFENIYMPGSSTPARNMHELNLHIRDSWSDVTILPEQIAEPPQRKNLARGAKVAASSVDKNRGENAVDETLDTRWGSERSDDQWIAVDLGSRQVVDGVKLVWEAAYGKAFAIQVSDDGARWRTVARTTSGDGGIDEIDFQAVPARYVRMHGLKRGTKWGYSLWEFEVYAAN